MHIQIHSELFLTCILVLISQQNSSLTYPVVTLPSSINIYLMFQTLNIKADAYPYF